MAPIRILNESPRLQLPAFGHDSILAQQHRLSHVYAAMVRMVGGGLMTGTCVLEPRETSEDASPTGMPPRPHIAKLAYFQIAIFLGVIWGLWPLIRKMINKVME